MRTPLRVEPTFTTERSFSNMQVKHPYLDWGISRF